MNEQQRNPEEELSRHSIRISRGKRKGRFMKRSTYIDHQKKQVKRLC